MADSDKNIKITPATGTTDEPSIELRSGDVNHPIDITVHDILGGAVEISSNDRPLLLLQNTDEKSAFHVADDDGQTILDINMYGVIDMSNSEGIKLPPGFSSDNPGRSAWHLMREHGYGQDGRPGNGWYWIKPSETTPAIRTYCDFTTEGGGWTMFYSAHSNRFNTFMFNNTTIDAIEDGFNLFYTPYEWRLDLKVKSQHEFLSYISSNGQFDSHARDNFYVAFPDNSAENFFTGSSTANSGIPGYGAIRGYSLGNGGYSGSYHANWWYNYNNYVMPHVDVGHVPEAIDSEDAFGYHGTRSTVHFPTTHYQVWMAR